MRDRLALFRVTALIAFRNLFTHRVTSFIVGSIILFGTALVVTGSALLDSIEAAMERSITSSFAGHIQIYSARGRDDIALFGSGFMASEDIGEMRDFAAVAKVVREIPNVEAVVPMGIQLAQVVGGNPVDELVESMRAAAREEDAAAVASGRARLKGIARDMVAEYQNRLEVSDRRDELQEDIAVLEEVQRDGFWSDARTLDERLLWVSTRIAPLVEDGQVTFLRLLGTDQVEFRRRFDRFRVVKGEAIPSGQRGLMLSNRSYEERLKHRVARWLDRLDEDSASDRSLIARDAELSNLVERLPGQYQRITLNLAPDDAAAMRRDLRGYLGRDAPLEALVRSLLTVTPANFDERRRAFYEIVAPRIELYQVDVGDVLTLRSFTQSGYLKSVNVKVWGVFLFDGLEGSDLAGAQNLIDLVSFRELYGVMTAETRAELSEIRDEIGLETVDVGTAEDDLFGGGTTELETRQTEAFDELAVLEEAIERADMLDTGFDQAQVQEGLALNAAVILRDASKLDETLAEIERTTQEAGLAVEAKDWQAAAGLVGQFVTVVRLVLYVAIVIIFLVALVIINNSMIMATMERVAEIGTMRAIGSSRSLVMGMIFLETLTLGVLAGGAGAGLGAAVIAILGQVGIPANNDVLVFLFSGPRLFPTFGAVHVVTGVVAIVTVSLVSTLYPARIATRIQPVVAMQRAE